MSAPELSDHEAQTVARFDTAPTPPEAHIAGTVACEDCWTRLPDRYLWQPSLPPHNCTERKARRLATAAEQRAARVRADLETAIDRLKTHHNHPRDLGAC